MCQPSLPPGGLSQLLGRLIWFRPFLCHAKKNPVERSTTLDGCSTSICSTSARPLARWPQWCTFLRCEFSLFYRYSNSEYCKRTVNNFETCFFAHCYQEHWQNEIHYKINLSSTLFPKRNVTFHAAFLLKKSVYQCPWGTILYGKDRQNQCPFTKGHQNSAPKGTVLWISPKGTILVPSIFSVFYLLFSGFPPLFIVFWVFFGFPQHFKTAFRFPQFSKTVFHFPQIF